MLYATYNRNLMLKTPLKDASYRKAEFDPVTYKVTVDRGITQIEEKPQ